MGGLTNRVYRIGDVVLRLPGRGTEAYIDRANEAAAAQAAAAAGVSPEVIHADPATGVMLTRFITGAVTMSPAAFRARPAARPAPPAPLRNCTARARSSPPGSSFSP